MSEDDPTKPRNAPPVPEGWDDELEVAPGGLVTIGTDFSSFNLTPDETEEVRRHMKSEGIDLDETYCYIGTAPGTIDTDGVDIAYIARRDAPELAGFIETFREKIKSPMAVQDEYKDRLFGVPHFVLRAAGAIKQ